MLYHAYAGERKRTTKQAYFPMTKDVIPDKAKKLPFILVGRPPVRRFLFPTTAGGRNFTRYYIKFFIYNAIMALFYLIEPLKFPTCTHDTTSTWDLGHRRSPIASASDTSRAFEPPH
jgi:hypothetical protein